MTYKSILVHTDPDPRRAGRLKCAAALAREFEAIVIGVGAEEIPMVDVSAGGAFSVVEGQWIAEAQDQVTRNLAAAEAVFRKTMGGQACAWRNYRMMPVLALSESARSADLIVVGGEDPTAHLDPYRAVDVARLVVSAGRPVLCCPPNDEPLSKRPALVAWKDTRESRRAVADAIPLLKRARGVRVVTICSESDRDSAAFRVQDVAEALGRHGIEATAETILRTAPAGQLILSDASRHDCGLIVAGAYGHSRLGEWVFGGVTRSLVRQDRHFVLLSH